jgi:DNA polymerase III delta subunit
MSKLSENIITLYGDDAFEINRYVENEVQEYKDCSIVDCSDIDLNSFISIAFGYDMFASKKYIFLKNIYSNDSVWKNLEKMLTDYSLNNVLYIIIGNHALQKNATFKFLLDKSQAINFKKWKEWDIRSAKNWLKDESNLLNIKLGVDDIETIIDWVGPDEQKLHDCLERLSLYDTFSKEKMHELIKQTNIVNNVFLLVELIIQKDRTKVLNLLNNIKSSSDPYQLIGLLSSQFLQVLYILSDRNAKGADLGMKDYSFNKTMEFSKKTNLNSLKKYIEKLSDADMNMKSKPNDNWIILEKTIFDLCM